ncbi:MAG: NUDIX hydrolase, partial [Gammaproteobacteria bacterium]|nr:NUDIX hydrolase [Gammaproteobacteria bacterium]
MSRLHLTVAAVVERQSRFLCVEEISGGRHVINQPAGHVETGESLRAAVVRETFEETAWRFEPTAISGIYLWEHPEKAERFLRVVFCGNVAGHDPQQALDDGILRAPWLSYQDLLDREPQLRSPMVLRAIDDFRNGSRYPVNMFQHIDTE